MTAFEIRLALDMLSGVLRQQMALAWGATRVHAFRAQVTARRALVKYFKKRRHARTRLLVLQGSVLVLVLLLLVFQPSDSVMATAAVGLAGIISARLAPGKVLKADMRKTVARMYGSRDG